MPIASSVIPVKYGAISAHSSSFASLIVKDKGKGANCITQPNRLISDSLTTRHKGPYSGLSTCKIASYTKNTADANDVTRVVVTAIAVNKQRQACRQDRGMHEQMAFIDQAELLQESPT